MSAELCEKCGEELPADGPAVECPVCHAKSECNVPAGGLIAFGIMSVLFGLTTVVYSGGPLVGGRSAGGLSVFILGYGVYTALAGGFQLYVGLQMKEAKQYALCWIACIAAVIPGIGPCGLGFLFGIMGISKLIRPRVRRGFQLNKLGFDPDAAP